MKQLDQYIQDNRENNIEYRFLYQFKHLNGRIPKAFILSMDYKPLIEKYMGLGHIKDIHGDYIWVEKQNENKNMKKRILKEERLSDQFAEYKVKDEKIKIILKNQQASKLTKIVNAWNDLSKQVNILDDQRKSIAASLATTKTEVEKLRDDAREAIIEIVDVNEAVMSIVVECAGSTLSLAKETDQAQTTDIYIDYKQAWESLYKLLEGDTGLKKMMDDTIKANTNVELSITQAKRALRLKQKEGFYKSGKILTEISLQLYFDKIINFIKKLIKKLWNTIDINKSQVKKYTKLVQNTLTK